MLRLFARSFGTHRQNALFILIINLLDTDLILYYKFLFAVSYKKIG